MKGTSLHQLPIKGMQRNTPLNKDNAGACTEVINARYQENAWRPVMPKVLVDVISTADEVYLHSKLGNNEYIVRVGQTIKVWKDGKFDTSKLNYALESGEVISDYVELGNYITFTTNKRHLHLLWDGTQYKEQTYIDLNSFSVSSDDTRPLWVDNVLVMPQTNFVHFSDTVFSASINYAKEDSMTAPCTIRELHNQIQSLILADDDHLHGIYMMRYAIKLKDGRYVYQSSPVTMNNDYSKWASAFRNRVGGSTSTYDNCLNPTVLSSNPSCIISDEFVSALQQDDIESFVICCTKPINNIDCFDISKIEAPDFDYNTITRTEATVKLLSENFIALDDGNVDTADFMFPYETDNLPNNLSGDGDFYIIKEILVQDLVAGQLFIYPQSNWSELDILEIDTTRYHEPLMGGLMDVYNKRTHLFNYQRELARLTTLVSNFEISSINSTTLQANYYAEVTVFENGIENKITKHIGYASSANTGLKFNTNYLTYPNVNATKLRLFAGVYGPPVYTSDNRNEVVYTFKKHPELNFVYIDNFNTTTNEYEIISGVLELRSTDINPDVDVTVYDGVMDNNSNIIVSDINYPLSYDSAHSYAFGDGIVIGLGVPTHPLSDGQFGEFPLYVFTSNGVKVLNNGSGEVLYASSNPVSREVPLNRASIKGSELGVMFLSQSGLNVLNGSMVESLSLLLMGQPLGELHGVADYQLYLGNSNIAADTSGLYKSFPSLWQFVDDIDFLDYISTLYKYSGYNDWFLPSIDDLIDIFASPRQLELSNYWSSTEGENDTASFLSGSDGSVGLNFKLSEYYTLAIRKQTFKTGDTVGALVYGGVIYRVTATETYIVSENDLGVYYWDHAYNKCQRHEQDYVAENRVMLGYAYGKNFKEIVICNPVFDYSYVFDLRTRQFHKITEVWDNFDIQYPLLIGTVNDGDISIFNLSEEVDSGAVGEETTTYADVLIETAPQLMGTERFKKIYRNVLRAYIKPHVNKDEVNPDLNSDKCKISGFYLFVSEDGYNWEKYDLQQTSVDLVDVRISGGVYKQLYFKYLFSGQLERGSNISSIQLQVDLKEKTLLE